MSASAVMETAKVIKKSVASAQAPLLPSVNSPAARVRAGRDRGPPVLERLRAEEQKQAEADEAAASKRRKSLPASAASHGAVQVRAGVPNGVGVLGRGRSARNATANLVGGDCLPAMMQRKQTLEKLRQGREGETLRRQGQGRQRREGMVVVTTRRPALSLSRVRYGNGTRNAPVNRHPLAPRRGG